MRSCYSLPMIWVLTLAFTANVQAQEGTAGSAVTPATTGTVQPPSPAVEPAKPLEKPALEKPKPIEKPRSVEAPAKPESTGARASEAAVLGMPAPNPVASSIPAAVRQEVSFPCIALAFAMLTLGAAAGFIGRHLMSRHKLGGMTVRVGTWRGIP